MGVLGHVFALAEDLVVLMDVTGGVHPAGPGLVVPFVVIPSGSALLLLMKLFGSVGGSNRTNACVVVVAEKGSSTVALMNIPDSTSIKSIVVSLLRDLLKTCTLKTLPLPEEVRASSLEACLQGLWYLGKELQQLGDSRPLAPEFLNLASLEIMRHIRTEKDEACRVMGRCVEALVVSHLAARTDSIAQISNKALGRISAILGTESDSRLWLGRSGAIELANMVSLLFSEIEALFSDSDTPSDMLDMIQRTLSVLSPTLLADLKAELSTSTDETLSYNSPIIHESNSRMCLKYLWHCARAYNQLGAEAPLPSFVRITLAGPRILRRIHSAQDLNARVTGRCFGALIVNKLVDNFNSRTSFSSGVYDADMACISSILDTWPSELLRWPNPSAVIKLLNIVSLMSGEIETLVTSGEIPASTPEWYSPAAPMPVDILHIIQQTIDIISPDLILGGAFAWGDLPMDEVSQLREICSKIANAQPDNRFKKHTMGILDQLQQISERLPTVEYKMRRCTSSIFGQQFVKGRSNSTTRPEYEARRRSKSI
ncbi:hypothetical protein H4582DRAFT_2051254 [Lactarius indigo]|nr:hypothetical protein H4582DRAFT_2051254 [Lactarius indigo]